MNVTTRLPNACPNHPEDRVVVTSHSSDNPNDPHRAVLTQYRCGAGCDTPLGWQFRYPDQDIFQHGTGQCRDQRVFDALRHSDYHNLTGNVCAAAALATTIPVAASIVGFIQPIPAEYMASALSIAVTAVVSIAAFVYHRHRNRPTLPSFSNP